MYVHACTHACVCLYSLVHNRRVLISINYTLKSFYSWVHGCLYSPVNNTFSQVPFHSFLFNIFVPKGRAVMLEQPRKTGVKVISHMLASHGGEIFIHILPTSRSILEDPPSISEGCGGRVTDYRITVRGSHHAAG